MKKIYLSILFMSVALFSFAQHDHSNCNHENCTLEGTGVDEFIFVPPPADFVPGAERDVVISMTYNDFPLEAQAAVQYAVDIWSSILTSDVPILVIANWTDEIASLASAGPAYGYPNPPGAIVPGLIYGAPLANKLAGEDLFTGSHDININVSSSTNWYYGTDGNTPSGQYDLVTVILHELCHGFGMSGTAQVNGNVGNWFYFENSDLDTFGIYDNFVENGGSTATTTFVNGSIALANELQSDDLFWNGTNAVINNGNLLPKLFAPDTWLPGSSFSHLDDATYPAGNINSLMTPFIGTAEAIHDPGPIIRGVMEDIGWTVNQGGGDECLPTGMDLEFDCPQDQFGDIYPAVLMTPFFSGDCFVETVCVQEVGSPTPECYDLLDFEIELLSGEGVYIPVNPNSSYNAWFIVDGNQSSTMNIVTGECTEQPGCTNPFAINYNENANIDDGSCIYTQSICDCQGTSHTIGVLTWLGDGFADDNSYEWDGQLVDFECDTWGYDCGDIAGSPNDDPYDVCSGNLPPNNGCGGMMIEGCTNPEADNYNGAANSDDASCMYSPYVFYVDFEQLSNGNPVAFTSDLITTWSGGIIQEDGFAFEGNAANGEMSMRIEQTNVDGGATDILVPTEVSTGEYELDFDMFVLDGFGAYYNIQGTNTPGEVFEMEVFLTAAGEVILIQEGEVLFTGNYTPNSWIPVSHQVDLDSNVMLVSIGTVVEYPVTLSSGLGGVNFYAFALDPSTGYYFVDNVSLLGVGGIPGCTDPMACNYNPQATDDDGSCEFESCAGCTNEMACNYDPEATIDDGSCDLESCYGCTDSEACNYDPDAEFDDGSCEFDSCSGCTDDDACNYDPDALIDDGSCEYETCAGCTDPTACNYDPEALIDDASCEFVTCAGCTDPLATNYDPEAIIEDGSCEYNFVICDCDQTEWQPSVLGQLGDGDPNLGAFQPNFNCETWGYDCGDIPGAPDMDPFGVCEGNLPELNGCSVGIDENKVFSWQIFPNPSEGDFTVNYQGPAGIVTIELLDLGGRLISAEQLQLNSSDTFIMNEDMTLAPGAYMIRMISDSTSEVKQVIVK